MRTYNQCETTHGEAFRSTTLSSQLMALQKHKTPGNSKRRFELLYQAAVSLLSPDELTEVSDRVQMELKRLGYLKDTESAAGLVRAIQDQLQPAGFPEGAVEQERIIQDVLQESFRQRRALLADALSAPQVAKLLHTSRQTPHNRAEKGTLLAIYENGKWLFPRWQFDAHGVDGVVAGLPEAWQALNVSPIEKLSWFGRRSPYLEDRTPLEVLKLGDIERVVSMAHGVGGQ